MNQNAPERFYTDENGLFPLLKRHCDSDIEYVRKDVVIQKSVDYISSNMRCDGYTLQTKANFIRDFKKYMEE